MNPARMASIRVTSKMVTRKEPRAFSVSGKSRQLEIFLFATRVLERERERERERQRERETERERERQRVVTN